MRFFCVIQESVSPVLWKFCNQIPLAFIFKFPGDSQSFCQIPRLGNLLWALELLQQCENFLVIIVLQFVGCLRLSSATCRASQVCSQSPCPCGRLLLTLASTGDAHTQAGLAQSLVGVTAPSPLFLCAQGFVCTLSASLVGLRFYFKCVREECIQFNLFQLLV